VIARGEGLRSNLTPMSSFFRFLPFNEIDVGVIAPQKLHVMANLSSSRSFDIQSRVLMPSVS